MKYKYIVLDFGKVIAAPTTGYWDLTPKSAKLIDINTLDIEKLKELRKKYEDILSEKVTTLEEEYDMFYRFYNSILSYFNVQKDIIKEIAYDKTYSLDKYTLYNNIHEELRGLKEKYKLILLTDNWPSVINYLKKQEIYDYFDYVYISSYYGTEKRDTVFFDYPINELNIKHGEALLIDNKEENLEIAKTKGFDVALMDRDNIIKESRYKIIHDLSDI